LARPDFRAAAARRLSEETELSPAIVSLLSSDERTRTVGVRQIPIDHIEANPEQPRMVFHEDSLQELSASIREHGVLQPILVRPLGRDRYQLIAGERRWRASRAAGRETIPALIEEIDDDTALEISIIENLQREDLSPLDEASMYDRMIRDHGYSVRKLAQKLGKDKGYLENRLRLANAPDEIRELVSVRKDTVSHAYELLKVEDPKKRRKLAQQVASGELSLVKLRERIEGRPTRRRTDAAEEPDEDWDEAVTAEDQERAEDEAAGWVTELTESLPVGDESLVAAKQRLAEAVEEFVAVLRAPDVMHSIGDVDRANHAKYLMIAKIKLENAIAMLRTGDH
jgi:ParB family transcriptional regulator, chromosome partitioning protein